LFTRAAHTGWFWATIRNGKRKSYFEPTTLAPRVRTPRDEARARVPAERLTGVHAVE
jgi:hypothetical protein